MNGVYSFLNEYVEGWEYIVDDKKNQVAPFRYPAVMKGSKKLGATHKGKIFMDYPGKFTGEVKTGKEDFGKFH